MAHAAHHAQQHQQHHPSPFDKQSARWKMFRTEGNLLYDTLLWTSSDWPLPAMQWQDSSWQLPAFLQELQQQAAADAEEEALAGFELDSSAAADASADADDMQDSDDEADHHTAGRRSNSNRQRTSGGKQLLPMPLDFQYLLTGEQADGREARHLVLWRVRLPGELPAGFDPAVQQLAMVRGEIEPVLVSC
jgi:hypothetical protein